HCIKNGVLAEFLRTHRSEVETVSLFEYDAEKHMAFVRAEGKEEERISLIIKKIKKSKSVDVIADELECEPEEIQKFYDVIQKCGTDCSAEEILENVYARR
ncbi:MAG: hypothetical protein R3Y58_13355, partial [Eubacteriales bacterium]